MAQIGGDNQAGSFVQLAQKMEQQGATDLAEWQVAQFIEDEQIYGISRLARRPCLPIPEA